MTVLPPVATEDAFTRVCQDEAALRPWVERLGRRLRIDVPGLTRFAVGSRPVYASGNLVLKLFPAVDVTGCRVEAGVLAAVQGKLPTPTPRVLATGEHDGWGYVLMSRLSGVALDTVWDRVPTRERDGLAGQLGETIAALHQLPLPDIPVWWPAEWSAFVARQRAECVRGQRSYGLPEAWAAQLDAFLDEGAAIVSTTSLPSGCSWRPRAAPSAAGLGHPAPIQPSGWLDAAPARAG